MQQKIHGVSAKSVKPGTLVATAEYCHAGTKCIDIELHKYCTCLIGHKCNQINVHITKPLKTLQY